MTRRKSKDPLRKITITIPRSVYDAVIECRKSGGELNMSRVAARAFLEEVPRALEFAKSKSELRSSALSKLSPAEIRALGLG